MEKIKSYIPLNLELMKNPINWVIIALMVLLAGFAVAFIMKSTTVDNGVSK